MCKFAKEITLNHGYVAIIDQEDFCWINQFKWHIAKRSGGLFYAMGQVATNHQLMHRVILGAKPGQEVDHINGDGLDNRRSNLRVCNHQQNLANSKIRTTNKSGYKGVYFIKNPHNKNKPWRAQIRVCGHTISLGCFNSPIEAATAYDNAAVRFNGEFSRINFQEEV